HHLVFGDRVPADHPPSWQALPNRPTTTGFVAFLTEGSTAEEDIAAEYLLPAEEVIQIAAHLAEHRALPETHVWVSYDAHGTPRYAGRCRSSGGGDNPAATKGRADE